MKGITVKLPETTLRRLRQEARATGCSVAALIRERLEAVPRRGNRSRLRHTGRSVFKPQRLILLLDRRGDETGAFPDADDGAVLRNFCPQMQFFQHAGFCYSRYE